MIKCIRNIRNIPEEINKRNHVIFIPNCEATNEKIIHTLASRGKLNIIFIHKNIPYLIPNSALLQSVLGPPDHKSIISALLVSPQISHRACFTLK